MAIIQVGLREQIELEYWVLFCEWMVLSYDLQLLLIKHA